MKKPLVLVVMAQGGVSGLCGVVTQFLPGLQGLGWEG